VSDSAYRGHRFPTEIISHCIWLHFRFGVSLRDVEELMAARGVLLSYETVRRWYDKFGTSYAAGLRRRRARTGDKWHLDEVFLKINGVTHYLWRAVDRTVSSQIFLSSQDGTDLLPSGSSASRCVLPSAAHA
jgi:putative transposase